MVSSKEYLRSYYQQNKEKLVARSREYRASNLERCRQTQKKYRDTLRGEVVALLGGVCAWPGCEWTDIRALQIDHKYGGGTKESKELGNIRLLRKVLKDPSPYQLLCANHNWVKKHENSENVDFSTRSRDGMGRFV